MQLPHGPSAFPREMSPERYLKQGNAVEFYHRSIRLTDMMIWTSTDSKPLGQSYENV